MRASRLITVGTTLLILAVAIPAPLLAATATLNPVKDNTLYEPIDKDNFEDRSNGAGTKMFAGRVKDADADPGPGTRVAVRRAVLEFELG